MSGNYVGATYRCFCRHGIALILCRSFFSTTAKLLLHLALSYSVIAVRRAHGVSSQLGVRMQPWQLHESTAIVALHNSGNTCRHYVLATSSYPIEINHTENNVKVSGRTFYEYNMAKCSEFSVSSVLRWHARMHAHTHARKEKTEDVSRKH